MKLHNYRLIEEEKKKMLSTDTQRSLWMIATITLLILIGIEKFRPPVISPLPETPYSTLKQLPMNVDQMIDHYASLYAKTDYSKFAIKVKIHYLLLRESVYGTNKNCGDSGKSCGPLQYRNSTFNNFRAMMMKLGLISDMGSRFDLEDSIQTTAWCMATRPGCDQNWGPIARGEIKL